MTRVILTYADVVTDMRTDDSLTLEGLETFVRVAFEKHTDSIVFASKVEAAS